MQIKHFKTKNCNFEVPGTEKCKVRAVQNETNSNLCRFQAKLLD